MTSTTAPGAPEPLRAATATAVAPTWRDLPAQPPYGPVRPPMTSTLGQPFAPPPVEQGSSITPAQIALAIGGTLLLVAIGIGAALLLLGGDDEVADVTAITSEAPRLPDPLPLDPVPVDPDPLPDAPQGQLEPQRPDRATEEAPPEGDAETPGDRGGGSQAAPDAPGGQQLPLPDVPGAREEPVEEGSELPRLFRLRTLPAGTEEIETTVQQTARGDERLTEQMTTLAGEEGDVLVRATRAADAADRLHAQVDAESEEVSVRGTSGYLIDGQRLVFLLAPPRTGVEETLIEIDATPATGTEALVTIANGMELLR